MKQIMNGCTAATHVAYALSDIATIYPITPVASMGEIADKWCLQGRLNVFGAPMQVKEMESELGAAGATHGALVGGALATTFTNSQGLMLMIPNMFKIAGELLPAVFHVGTRSVATHALSIFGDHEDVMACRTTGFAMLASASVQETMDLALAAHLAAIKGRVPVLHFFDGWRTSNQFATIDVIPYDTMAKLVDQDAVAQFRKRAMNPEHPDTRGTAQNPDVYFQNREAANKYYDAFPEIVEEAMRQVQSVTGRAYNLFDYYGPADAEQVVISIGSSTLVLREVSEALNSQGKKTGVVAVRLYRPFRADKLLAAIPSTVKCISVLDRTKEPGSQAEPLLLDVMAAVQEAGRDIRVVGGRYGLSSKDFNPAMAEAVFLNAASPSPKPRFTVGINDDVTHLSLPVPEKSSLPDVGDSSLRECVFYGMGSDGTVGATQQMAAILSGTLGFEAQAYFHYSAKKSGGYTISELRYGPKPVTREYSIESADYVGCNKDTYVDRFLVASRLRQGGVFVLNSAWTDEELESRIPARLKRTLAAKKARFFNVNAVSLAQKLGLGVRINVIMETIFFHLVADPSDLPKILDALKTRVSDTYRHEGNAVVQKNLAAIDQAPSLIHEVEVPAGWASATEPGIPEHDVIPPVGPETMKFIDNIAKPCTSLLGDSLPVSAFTADGIVPPGTTAWEKRRIAVNVPQWNPDKCVTCTECSLVCSHAAIRPVVPTLAELKNAPAEFVTKPIKWKPLGDDAANYRFRIQVYPEDCTGCASCATVCPGHALDMVPLASQLPLQEEMLKWSLNVADKPELMPAATIPGTQLRFPHLEFSGACGGCGETPYVKLLTQLFGKRMAIANATGCSSIWGADFPSNSYCADKDGRGPAWGNSLFEDNAEYGFGIASAFVHRRQRLLSFARQLMASATAPAQLKSALQVWIDAFADAAKSRDAADALVRTLKTVLPSVTSPSDAALASALLESADMLAKKTVWAVGGDGWAFDIGFAGLDHVLAQNIDINILVLDTECYSNTGGQTSKATPLGAVMKYAAHGKRTPKKDLGRMMMTYGNVYVAQIALGANYGQAIKAMLEADSYPGPSIVIAYCPCIEHGIRTGMSHTIVEERLAVQCGYWDIFRYDPRLADQGKTPLQVDEPAPNGQLDAYLDNEDRYADLKLVDPAAVQSLRKALADRESRIYAILTGQQSHNDC